MKSSSQISRKDFLSRILAVWGGISIIPVFYGIIEYIIPPKIRNRILSSIRVATFNELPVDDAKIVKFNKTAVALLRTEQGQVKAFSAICTHLGCVVQYQPDRKVFHCNCHGSEFDTNGKNIAGPAPAPLQPYRVELKDQDVIISQI